jgi:hypothetical protein
MGYSGGSAQFSALLKELGQIDFSPNMMNKEQAFKFLQTMSGIQTELDI